MNLKPLLKPIIYFLVLVVVFLVVWLLIRNYSEDFREIFSTRNGLQAGLTAQETLFPEKEVEIPQNLKPARDWTVEDLRVLGNAAICVDTDLLNDKVLFKKNEQESFPIASLTKLMTALIVLESYYELDQVVFISEAAVNQPGDQGLLTPGEVLSIKNLLYIMLIESSNDAAYALAEIKGIEQFIGLMNLKAMELRLFSSNFVDVSGLSSDNYSTAEDLVILTKYLLERYPLIWEILSNEKYKLLTPQRKLHHELTNTNELLGKIPDIIGGKTGSTLRAKGCLLLILKNQNEQSDLIYVILGSDDRFGEMEQLIDWVNKAYQW